MEGFISHTDYRVVIGEKAYEVVSQSDCDNLANTEAEAQEEISGYLRPRYDVNAIFSARGDDRNKLIVMYMCDIALYHMSASLPGRMNIDIRKERYDSAISWLKDVQAGKVVPDLPLATDSHGESSTPMHFGYATKTNNIW